MFEYEEKNVEGPFYKSYKIKKGDTLYQISKEFNVNTKLLAELNGLDMEEYIYPGQTILIPKENVSYYITKEGDTLFNLENIFGTSQDDLIQQNKTIYLLPGQMIYYKK